MVLEPVPAGALLDVRVLLDQTYGAEVVHGVLTGGGGGGVEVVHRVELLTESAGMLPKLAAYHIDSRRQFRIPWQCSWHATTWKLTASIFAAGSEQTYVVLVRVHGQFVMVRVVACHPS